MTDTLVDALIGHLEHVTTPGPTGVHITVGVEWSQSIFELVSGEIEHPVGGFGPILKLLNISRPTGTEMTYRVPVSTPEDSELEIDDPTPLPVGDGAVPHTTALPTETGGGPNVDNGLINVSPGKHNIAHGKPGLPRVHATGDLIDPSDWLDWIYMNTDGAPTIGGQRGTWPISFYEALRNGPDGPGGGPGGIPYPGGNPTDYHHLVAVTFSAAANFFGPFQKSTMSIPMHEINCCGDRG